MKSITHLMAMAVIALAFSGCLGKEESDSGPTTVTKRCVERSDPNDNTSTIVGCHELTYLSDNTGFANAKCNIAANVFTGQTCTDYVTAQPGSHLYIGKCAETNRLEGLDNPDTTHTVYCYDTSPVGCLNNGAFCGAIGGVWTDP